MGLKSIKDYQFDEGLAKSMTFGAGDRIGIEYNQKHSTYFWMLWQMTVTVAKII